MQDVVSKTRNLTANPPQQRHGGSAPASQISKDLHIKGNMSTSNDIIVHGRIEGDVQARVLTVGETANLVGHIRADEVILNGRVAGEVRGKKVRLNKSARVEGDIIHGTISIEAGAYFEGSVKRAEDPIGNRKVAQQSAPKPVRPAGGPPQARPSVAPKRQS